MTAAGKALGNEPAMPDGAGAFFLKGLTKREHFAGLALQGIQGNASHSWNDLEPGKCAERALLCADALLDELARDKS